MHKCEHTTYVGPCPDGEGRERCYNQAIRQVYIGERPDGELQWRCREHGGALDSVQAGQYIDTERFPLDKVMDAYDREGRPQETHENVFTLAELFSSEDLRHPDKCKIRLITQLTSCGTNGSLQTRALLIVSERPPKPPKPQGPYR